MNQNLVFECDDVHIRNKTICDFFYVSEYEKAQRARSTFFVCDLSTAVFSPLSEIITFIDSIKNDPNRITLMSRHKSFKI